MYETRDYNVFDVFRELPINSAWLKEQQVCGDRNRVSKVGMITKDFLYFIKEFGFHPIVLEYVERF